jgi:TIR domain
MGVSANRRSKPRSGLVTEGLNALDVSGSKSIALYIQTGGSLINQQFSVDAMSSLAKYYSSSLVGFFSYSREDDVDLNEVLSKFRNAIQAELSAQLGRNRDNFRIWQDRFAIPHGALWQKQITDGVKQSAFFIPIITPRMVNSPHCSFEFESFLAREKELGRDDLIFPILYISVPELGDGTWKQNSVLKIVNDRQYLDWRDYRPRELSDPEIRKELIQFCSNISNALRKPWVSPEDRQQRQEAEAVGIAAADERRTKTQPRGRRKKNVSVATAARAAEEERKKLTAAQAPETAPPIEDERQRRAAEASRVAEEKQRGRVAEAPTFAVAAASMQNTKQESSLSVRGDVYVRSLADQLVANSTRCVDRARGSPGYALRVSYSP